MPLDSKTLPRLNWSIRVLALVFLTFFCWANPSHGQQDQIDSLAAKVASAIHKSFKKASDQQLVMVVISEPVIGPTELGAKIADQFTAALAGRGIPLMSSATLQQAADGEKILPVALRDPGTLACVASDAGAAIIVDGTIQLSGKELNLAVSALRAKNAKPFFKEKLHFALTPDLAKLQAEALPAPSAPKYVQGPVPDIYNARENGYTAPRCVYCPIPRSTGRAFSMHEQGTIVLGVVVGPDARARAVTLLHGLSCGLNQQAIDIVENVYRFKPATGPDGKPAAVHMLMEVQFRLY